MNSLDDKLRVIVEKLYLRKQYTSTEEFREEIPQWIIEIKQAFMDEGYWKPVANGTVGGKQSKNGDNGVLLMTGQEWYDRFLAEENKIELSKAEEKLIEFYPEEMPLMIKKKVHEAAKRAAGLEL